MNITLNREQAEVEGPTIQGLLSEKELPQEAIVVAVNGDDVVRRDEWGGSRLREGDEVEIVHAVAGGVVGRMISS